MKIILIGFMRSGKTTVAPLLAQKLSLDVIETDELIRQMAGKTTDEIFTRIGEVGYREYEISVAKSLKDTKNTVISTGGGVVMNKIILDYLKPDAKTIFLETTFDTLVKREDITVPRPLFKTLDEAKKLYEFRYPLYKEYADIHIKTDDKTPEEITEEIIRYIKL